jgi:hypothetical protein
METRTTLIARTCCVTVVVAAAFFACSNTPQGPELSLTGGAPLAGHGGSTSATGGSGSGARSSGSGGSGAAGPIVVSVGGGSTTDAGDGPCVGLACQQTSCTLGACTEKACASGASTTVSGTVYDPAGKVPLYNAVVYVPNAPAAAIKSGATCDRCDAAVLNPVASTLTDTHGNFKLDDVPVGSNIPLVIQIGKWRRQITIPSVTACTDTALTDPNQTRLPRNKTEGDIPLIAIATGALDSMECLPRRMGIDDAEFTTEAGDGRINLYAGSDLPAMGGFGMGMGMGTGMGAVNTHATKAFAPTLNAGAKLSAATSLWDTLNELSRYDIVILSCEGATLEQEKPPTARQALYDYASAGGRVFASHWHRVWFSDGPAPVPTVGTWSDRKDPSDPQTGTINTSFPKGAALSDWLVNVNASTTPGQLVIHAPRDNVQTVNDMLATEWISVQNDQYPQSPSTVEYLTFNAPLAVPDAQQCGRVVFTDLHVSSTGADMPGQPFPSGCEMRDLSPQEKAVEFMLFDLSSCVTNDHNPPVAPPVK